MKIDLIHRIAHLKSTPSSIFRSSQIVDDKYVQKKERELPVRAWMKN
jgi:hypothetical protein